METPNCARSTIGYLFPSCGRKDSINVVGIRQRYYDVAEEIGGAREGGDHAITELVVEGFPE